jgi:hypothetical protein
LRPQTELLQVPLQVPLQVRLLVPLQVRLQLLPLEHHLRQLPQFLQPVPAGRLW